MATINVTFIGICTYLMKRQNFAPDNPAWGTRIVVPNSTDPTRINQFYGFTGDDAIAPHRAYWAIIPADGSEPLREPLAGDTMKVSSDETILNTLGVTCLPGLGSIIRGIGPGAAATSKNPDEASCYFDFTAGTLTATVLPGGAGSIVYTTQSANPTVTITPFDGQNERTIQLPAGDKIDIVIWNLPLSGRDDNDHDFLLSFLITNAWPQKFTLPGPTECPPNLEGGRLMKAIGYDRDIGMGCSNSNIP
jgi:hypothetical protein